MRSEAVSEPLPTDKYVSPGTALDIVLDSMRTKFSAVLTIRIEPSH